MKKLSSILPVLALLIAVAGAFAMKPAPKNNLVLTYYFRGVSGQEFDPTKYTIVADSCIGNTLTCQFDVPDGYSSITDYMSWLNNQLNKESLYEAQVVSKRS